MKGSTHDLIGSVLLAVVLLTIVCLAGYLTIVGSRAAAALLVENGVSAGERLQFYGSLLGAAAGSGLAIFGAIFVENVRRAAETGTDRALIRDALEELRDAMRPVVDAPAETDLPPNGELGPLRQQILAIVGEIQSAKSLFAFAVRSAKLKRFADIRALEMVIRALDTEGPVFDREMHVISGHAPTRGIISVYYQRTQPAAAALLAAVEHALRVFR